MKLTTALAAALLVAGCATEKPAARPTPPAPPPPAPAPEAVAASARLSVPIEYHKLDNGLRVVLSPDHSTPTVRVAVYYNIGLRIEPKDRTGFAHLFEHMMFQGSRNLGKMEFMRLVQSNGGILNGSTRFDFTNYFEIVPAHTLETILWAEADRMKGLAVTQDNLVNQQGVVKNEVKVNVLNRPYGGFPWLDVPQVANVNWYNSHNFYGELGDLDAATLADVKSFFETYYAPSNAALALVGDFDPPQALAWVKKYFGDIPSVPKPPRPDVSEPRQDKERRADKVDPLAERPALAVAYHMPDRNTPEHLAMGLIDQILVQGKDSRLYAHLVQKKKLTGEVTGGINLLGNTFNYDGPMLWTVAVFHDKGTAPEQLVAAMEEVIEPLRREPVDAATLERARVKMRSALYDTFEEMYGFGLADLLASFALFDDDPGKVNRLEEELMKVTPELIQKTAQEYLRPTNRTVLSIHTKS
jgi:predicted Zn-dependent peptidase